MLLCVHAQSCAGWVHLTLIVVSLCAYERRHPSLAPANIKLRRSRVVHLSLFSYKHLWIVPCAWFVDSIAVPTPNEAHQSQSADGVIAR